MDPYMLFHSNIFETIVMYNLDIFNTREFMEYVIAHKDHPNAEFYKEFSYSTTKYTYLALCSMKEGKYNVRISNINVDIFTDDELKLIVTKYDENIICQLYNKKRFNAMSSIKEFRRTYQDYGVNAYLVSNRLIDNTLDNIMACNTELYRIAPEYYRGLYVTCIKHVIILCKIKALYPKFNLLEHVNHGDSIYIITLVSLFEDVGELESDQSILDHHDKYELMDYVKDGTYTSNILVHINRIPINICKYDDSSILEASIHDMKYSKYMNKDIKYKHKDIIHCNANVVHLCQRFDLSEIRFYVSDRDNIPNSYYNILLRHNVKITECRCRSQTFTINLFMVLEYYPNINIILSNNTQYIIPDNVIDYKIGMRNFLNKVVDVRAIPVINYMLKHAPSLIPPLIHDIYNRYNKKIYVMKLNRSFSDVTIILKTN